jgi:hypothetical protein
MKLFFFLLAAIFTLTQISSKGAEWQSVVLSGTFTSDADDATQPVLAGEDHGHLIFRNYARGSGLTAFSPSLRIPVEDNSSSLDLLVDFIVPSATSADFSLASETMSDLGAPTIPPKKIKVPGKGWIFHNYTSTRRMVVGNYYYVAQSGQHFIIQPSAFEVSDVKVADQAPGLFGYTIHSAKCTLKFRFLSASTLDGLQQLIRSSPWPGIEIMGTNSSPPPSHP